MTTPPAESRIKNSTCYIAHSADSVEGEWSGGDNEFICGGAGVYADEGSPGAGEEYEMQEPEGFLKFEEDVEIGHPDFALRDTAPEKNLEKLDLKLDLKRGYDDVFGDEKLWFKPSKNVDYVDKLGRVKKKMNLNNNKTKFVED